MSSADAPGAGRRSIRFARLAAWPRRQPAAAAIAFLCLSIEAILEGADAHLWGSPAWRGIAFNDGAFWGGLLQGAHPAFPLQPLVMFLSYSLLHGGFWHVALNMLTLVSLAPPVTARLGQRRFLTLYLLSAIGGGAGFALFSFTTAPMIGASGALFGLAGAILAWALADRRAIGQSRLEAARALARPILYLILLNVVMFWAMAGGLAWGCHLGGFLTGWALALWLDPRRYRFSKMRR